jgi:hypothetical protein
MKLRDWQAHLETHFSALSKQRENKNLPIFAFEHGLNEEQLRDIHNLLDSKLEMTQARDYWLVWVVSATEFGYLYDDTDYWPTFEKRRRLWSGDRKLLKLWFERFQQEYRGVTPQGKWSKHFSNITWPITHAILPKYLQRELSRVLYDVRYKLAHLEKLEPRNVGDLIARADATKRFQGFAQQRELVGRIVLALLNDTKDEKADLQLIHPSSLERIVSDLRTMQQAGLWLKEARQTFSGRFKGLYTENSKVEQFSQPPNHLEQPLETKATASVKVKPSLLLVRTEKDTWTPVIDIPSFKSFSHLSDELNDFLRKTRCKVSHAGDIWLPAGWILNPARKTLNLWPRSNETMLEFEEEQPILKHILDSDFRISSGPFWLYLVGADGYARELKSRQVRPNKEYLLLTEDNIKVDAGFIYPQRATARGVNVFRLSIPSQLSSDAIKELSGLGLSITTAIQIRPVGLNARAWDGEGYSEWLTTQHPSFCLTQEHEVESYRISLNEAPEEEFKTLSVNAPIFVSLPRLSVGRHTLRVKVARPRNEAFTNFSGANEASMDLLVRDPTSWAPGTSSYSGFSVRIDPSDITLDGFLDERAKVSVFGPENHRISCFLSLESKAGDEILSRKIGDFDIPFQKSTWARSVRKALRDNNGELPLRALEAALARLTFKSDTLGTYSFALENDMAPIKWVCLPEGDGVNLRLIDNTGSESIATVSYRSFNKPTLVEDIPVDIAYAGFPCKEGGGFFFATLNEHSDAIAVTSRRKTMGLSDLIIDPDLSSLESNDNQIDGILLLLHELTNSRSVGFLSTTRRMHVLKQLEKALYTKVCGDYWVKLEEAFLNSPNDEVIRERLKKNILGISARTSFAATLNLKYEDGIVTQDNALNIFEEAARNYDVCRDINLSRLAYRLMSEPDKIIPMYNMDYLKKTIVIPRDSGLLRGARFLRLLLNTDVGVDS